LKSIAFAFGGIRLQGSYVNLRQLLSAGTIPRLEHKTVVSSILVAKEQ